MSTTQLELLVERALPSCSLVRNSTYQSYDKDTKHTKERKLVSCTSFFHQQADVIGQVSLFIVLAARSPVTPLYSIIVSADSIVTRKTREKRVVFSLSSESEMWRMEDEAVEAGVGGCVSGHKGEKYKRTRERRRQLETRHFVLTEQFELRVVPRYYFLRWCRVCFGWSFPSVCQRLFWSDLRLRAEKKGPEFEDVWESYCDVRLKLKWFHVWRFLFHASCWSVFGKDQNFTELLCTWTWVV